DVNQDLYWTSSNQVTGAAIYKKTLAGSPTLLVSLPAGANPRGIAVDHQNGFIFWADAGLNRIYRATTGGGRVGIALSRGSISRPGGVALNPTLQRVYFTEFGLGTIFRVDYFGGFTQLILNALSQPTYIAYDAPNSRLYWVEAARGLTQRLRRADVSGSNK